MSKEEELRKAISEIAWGDDIVKLCSTPHSTSEIRRAYDEWRTGIIVGATLEDALKGLENVGAIKYTEEGKWQSTKEALEVIEKYFG